MQKEKAMDASVKAILNECTRGSDEERLSFPEVVAQLARAGVEQYHADLRRAEKTYYMPDGDSCVVPTSPIAARAGESFSASGVEAAVRATQAQTIGYHAFCERILKAGCVSYIVSLAGRRAVYLGRTGESFIEPFPPAR
jgi:uncharacterized protein YbcV (DUF1398 family)